MKTNTTQLANILVRAMASEQGKVNAAEQLEKLATTISELSMCREADAYEAVEQLGEVDGSYAAQRAQDDADLLDELAYAIEKAAAKQNIEIEIG